MSEKYKDNEEMEFCVMDITNIQYPENCFDIIIDKGTLDCLFCAKNSYAHIVKALKVYS